MKKTLIAASALFLALTVAVNTVDAQRKSKAQKNREEINAMAKETLETLFAKNSDAKELAGKAYGYAVFDNIKISLGITGGGGRGVAVVKEFDKRTYMKMGTVGLNLGLGGQKYQIVFLFQTKSRFDEFVEEGWEADASANAVAGDRGVNAEVTFRNGMAFYQLTQAGLMLQADISGTKYWKNKKLNNRK